MILITPKGSKRYKYLDGGWMDPKRWRDSISPEWMAFYLLDRGEQLEDFLVNIHGDSPTLQIRALLEIPSMLEKGYIEEV